jgi:hypothetical protein
MAGCALSRMDLRTSARLGCKREQHPHLPMTRFIWSRCESLKALICAVEAAGRPTSGWRGSEGFVSAATASASRASWGRKDRVLIQQELYP